MKTLEEIERHAFAGGDIKTVALVQQMQDVIEEETGESAEEGYDRGYRSGQDTCEDCEELERKYNSCHTLLVNLRTALAAKGAFDRKDWLRRVRGAL